MCMIKKQLPDNLSLLAKQLQNSENALKGVAVRQDNSAEDHRVGLVTGLESLQIIKESPDLT